MFGSAIVAFREVLEVSLILGVILAATKDVSGRNKWIYIGLGAGVIGSILLAKFADVVSNAAEGMGQELFNATVLLIASAMIGWTVVWMRKHARSMVQRAKRMAAGIIQGDTPLYSIAIVIALASLREGSEIVLFTYGMAAAGVSIFSLGAGLALGMVAGSVVGAMLYYGLIKISPKYMFAVVSWLLVLVAAGMASVAAKFLASAGYFEQLSTPVWDTSFILSEQNIIGQTFHTLLGYSAKPLGIQLIFYIVTLGVLIMAMRIVDRPTRVATNTLQTAAKLSSLALLAAVCVSHAKPAEAAMKVYSPYVHKGELEIEWRGQYKVDDNDDVDGAQKQKLAVGYGVNDRWFTEVYGEFEKEGEDGSDYEFTAIEWENKFQLTEQGEHFVDVGLLAEYAISLEDDHADKAEIKMLFAKDTGQFTHYANIGLEKELGAHSEDGTEASFAWSTRYRYNAAFQPGIEVFSEFGELNESKPYDEQEHYVGPAIYGRLGSVSYDVGYLFGVSDAASDGVVKAIIEYERYF